MIRKVLVGYDGSESSGHALEFAAELASRFGAGLHVVAVARQPEIGDDVETTAMLEQSRKVHTRLLDEARGRLAPWKIEVSYQVLLGHPAEQLVRYAEANTIDHIVVGHRGRTMFERWLIGSVARQVIAYAHCAVTVIRK
jgi:nucleotide-binding universal stress UspA family protein